MHTFVERPLKSSLSTDKSTVFISFFTSSRREAPKIHPLCPIPSQVFNLIPHLRPAWNIIQEMRSVPLNTECETAQGQRMETWPDSAAKRHALVGGRRPGSPPQVAWLNICPPPLGCLDTSTQPSSHHSSVRLRSGESWHGRPGRAPKPWQKKKFLLTARGHRSSTTWKEWALHF